MHTQLKSYIDRIFPVPDDAWQAMFDNLKTVTLYKKDNFVTLGQVCNRIGFINKGAIRVYHPRESEEYTSFFFFDNEFVTDYDSFLKQAPSKFYYQAIEDTEIVYFDYEFTRTAYDQYRYWDRFGRFIAEQLFCSVCDERNSLLFDTPEDRYAKLVAVKHPMLQRAPQYMIASYLGITPVHLSRIKAKTVVSQ